jgi:PAS domain S-box-containing protein
MQWMTEWETNQVRSEIVDEPIQNPKEFIEILFNSVSDWISVINTATFKIEAVNKAFLDKLNVEEKDVIGKHCYEVNHHQSEPCEPPEHHCPLKEILKTGCRSSAVHVHYDKEGRKKIIQIIASPIVNEKGEIKKVAHIARDITERRQVEEALSESGERYRRLTQAVTDYIYTVVGDNREGAESNRGGSLQIGMRT